MEGLTKWASVDSPGFKVLVDVLSICPCMEGLTKWSSADSPGFKVLSTVVSICLRCRSWTILSSLVTVWVSWVILCCCTVEVWVSWVILLCCTLEVFTSWVILLCCTDTVFSKEVILHFSCFSMFPRFWLARLGPSFSKSASTWERM